MICNDLVNDAQATGRAFAQHQWPGAISPGRGKLAGRLCSCAEAEGFDHLAGEQAIEALAMQIALEAG